MQKKEYQFQIILWKQVSISKQWPLPQQQAVAKIRRPLPVNHWYHQKESSNENHVGLLMEKTLQPTKSKFNLT